MEPPLVVVTGFGPFLDVKENPSGKIARLLASEPPAGIDVHGLELPVSFAGSPRALAEGLASLEREPVLLLGLGVHRGAGFRVERRARAVLDSHKPDSEGVFAEALAPLSTADLRTSLMIDGLHEVLDHESLAATTYSDDAGGYVCERTYHALLTEASRRDVPALFIHVPGEEHLDVPDQSARIAAAITRLLNAS